MHPSSFDVQWHPSARRGRKREEGGKEGKEKGGREGGGEVGGERRGEGVKKREKQVGREERREGE